MSKKNDGGYAFPMEATDATAWRDCNQGMTLRDYFAAKAMQAMITAHEPQGAIPGWAYEMADEMLRAREAS
ncbi:hypothetical protein [Enterobacter hormaechei]|uniref:hypothetical protein n=1 Tax=Enterobacteriaceae TaxID=543 RepID=UPI0039FBFF8E